MLGAFGGFYDLMLAKLNVTLLLVFPLKYVVLQEF
jgi:hypothetical protein